MAVTTGHRESLSTDLMRAMVLRRASLLPCSLGACGRSTIRDVPARFERVPTTTPALAERLLARRHEPESLPNGPCQQRTGASHCRTHYDRPQSTNPPTTLGHARRRMERHAHCHNATCTHMRLECASDPSAVSPMIAIDIQEGTPGNPPRCAQVRRCHIGGWPSEALL